MTHTIAQVELIEQLSDGRVGRYRARSEPTLKSDEKNGPTPGVLVTPRDAAIGPESADLVVEVADSSLAYDRSAISAPGTRAGVREYWTVDLQHEAIERYVPAGAATQAIVRIGDVLAPLAYPDVRLDIAAPFAAARRGRRID